MNALRVKFIKTADDEIFIRASVDDFSTYQDYSLIQPKRIKINADLLEYLTDIQIGINNLSKGLSKHAH